MGGSSKQTSIYKFKRAANGKDIDTSTWSETVFYFHTSASALGNKYITVFEYLVTAQDVREGYEFVIGASSNTPTDTSVQFFFLALAGAGNQGGPITATSRELFNVNFIDALPYKYNKGVIAGPGMKITTFHVKLLTTSAETGVSFNRILMTASATASYNTGRLSVTPYDHTVPATTEKSQ